MKNLCVAFVLLVCGSVLFAGEIVRTVEFSSADLRFSKTGDYDIVELRGYPSGIKVGEPRLPHVVQALLLPAGAIPTSVELVADEVMDIRGVFNIPPAQPDQPLPMPGKIFTPREFAANQDIYSTDEFYPVNLVRLSGSGNKAGFSIGHIEIFPLLYNPVKKTVQLVKRMTYCVHYQENPLNGFVPTEYQKQVFTEAIRSFIVNPEDLYTFAPLVGKKSGQGRVPPGSYKYVIISGATNLDSIFQRLANWKTKKGISATVVQISYINSNYTGYDLQDKIRNFIIDAYTNWGTVFVLLGGSADHKSTGQNLLPERNCYYTASGVGSYNDEDTIPTDLYFAGLSGTWDANSNHVYGQTADNADMYSDVYVGRASVYSVAQAQNFVYKVLKYEKNPPTGYLRKMILPTGILWSSYEERPMQDSIAKMTPSPWQDAKMYERTSTLSEALMIDSMNVGFAMGAWEGHGNEDGIYYNGGSSPYLTSTDADGLTNGDKQGINISIACFTGAWDETPSGDCLAEHLVNRVGGGLVSSMMNSRYGWGAYVSGYVPGPSERLDTTFFSKIFQGGLFKCGQVLAVDKSAWVPYADSGNQYDMTRWCIYELNLLGDPELPLWTSVPAALTVGFPAAINIGNQVVNVTVTGGGSPVNNALVCLMKGTETYGTAYTNASGLASVSVAPTTPGFMDITVTAKNYYPFEDTIIVQSSSYAYVSYLKSSVSDPAPGGNNDGVLNPGESVEIPLWVKNYGSQPGNNVVGRLRTTDTYVSLADTIKNFGTVPANDSATTGSDGFNAVVAGNCPNGHGVLLTLVCKDNIDSTWTSQFGLMVYAPILTYQSVSVVGGNGNGILDPGETANLVATIKNDGGAVASSVTSTLMESSAYITIGDASGNFGTINVGATASNNSDPYTVTASASTPTGTTVNFQIQVVSGLYVDTLDFSLVVGKKHYYIWNPDPTPTPGSNMHTILGNLGYSGDYGTTLAANLTMYNAVLVCVGIYSSNYIIASGSPEATALATYLQSQGGRMYLEGGDVWYYDPSYQGGYNFGTLFGINATADGSSDMGPITGRTGTFTNTMTFAYGGENNYMDHISPTGTGAFLIFTDNAPYDCGVANVQASYKTVGCSFELGLLTDGSGVSTRAALLDSIMRFFGNVLVGVEEREGLTGLVAEFGLRVYPSIAQRDVRIAYSLGQSAKSGALKIYDASGRMVRSFTLSPSPLALSILWNGTDDAGHLVPAGVYFVKLETADKQAVQKAVLLR